MIGKPVDKGIEESAIQAKPLLFEVGQSDDYRMRAEFQPTPGIEVDPIARKEIIKTILPCRKQRLHIILKPSPSAVSCPGPPKAFIVIGPVPLSNEDTVAHIVQQVIEIHLCFDVIEVYRIAHIRIFSLDLTHHPRPVDQISLIQDVFRPPVIRVLQLGLYQIKAWVISVDTVMVLVIPGTLVELSQLMESPVLPIDEDDCRPVVHYIQV